MADGPQVFVIDPNEVERYARAIAHIVGKGHAAGSAELERAVNTYGTAFQFLVMRRGPRYGRALGLVAGDQALALVARREEAEGRWSQATSPPFTSAFAWRRKRPEARNGRPKASCRPRNGGPWRLARRPSTRCW